MGYLKNAMVKIVNTSLQVKEQRVFYPVIWQPLFHCLKSQYPCHPNRKYEVCTIVSKELTE